MPAKLNASSPVSAFLAAATKETALAALGLNVPVQVLTSSERKTLSTYDSTGGPVAG